MATCLSPGLHAQSLQSQVDVLAAEVKSDAALSDERRAALQGTLQETSRAITSTATYRDQQGSLEETLATAEDLIGDYESRTRDIQRAPATVDSRLGRNPSLSDIVAEIGTLEIQRSSWNKERTEALNASSSLPAVEEQRRQRLAALDTELAELKPASNSQPGDLAERVRALAADARRAQLEAEQELLNLRQRAAPVEANIRTASIAWLDAAIAETDRLLEEMRSLASARRQSAAEQQRAETRRILNRLSDASPDVQAIAEQNLALSDEFQDLGTQIGQARSNLASLQLMTESIEEDANLTRRRLGVAGLESELGTIMLTRLESLPDARVISGMNQQRNQRIGTLSINAIDMEQELRGLSDPTTLLRGAYGAYEDWPLLEQRVAVQLLEQRRRLVQENLEATNTLLRLLVDSNSAADELTEATDEYEKFLTANLLWVRNYSFATVEEVTDQLDTLSQVVEADLATDKPGRALEDPYLVSVALLLAVLLLRRGRMKEALVDMLGKPIAPRDESAALIARALFLTFLVSLAAPLTLVLIAKLELVWLPKSTVSTGVSDTLQWAALAYLILDFLERLSGRLGAGRRLLKWNSSKLDVAVRDLGWLKFLLTLAVLIIGLGRASSPTDSGGALSALGSCITAACILIATYRMSRSEVFASDGLAKLALRLGILVSAAIVIMHVSGRLFAAHLYLTALVGSIAAIVLVLLLSSILQRLLLINQANLSRKAREELKALEAGDSDNSEELAEQGSDLETVTSLSDAYAKLLSVARVLAIGSLLWVIWEPALPALEVLDAITLWTTEDPSLPAGQTRDVTVTVLLLSVLILAVTFFVTRHLPPLINVMLMEWSHVSAGGRYATGMLTQYVIIGVGLSVSLGLLGFQWSKVQWLVAALGVGIGFGLQEIVANFISGLIVLFERPIRVGDIINAGGHDGTVTRINPRATVIQTFERKEVMIPNKELITSVVTNWSLSDTQLRVLVPVGVSYGTDVGKAMRILLEIARAHPDVLDDPEPMVTFEDFGDNALVLWIRCYASSDYLRVGTELRERVYNRLNDEGIGIAFPQRDVHLDTVGPIPVQVVGTDPT